ncbi:MAG: tetratricopeptide repeat protein [Chitinispirillaceae bacterium]
MSSQNPDLDSKGLSFPVILISGLVLACLLLGATLAIRFIYNHNTPSLDSTERLLKKGKFQEALAVLDKVDSQKGERSRKRILRGRIIFGLLNQELRNEQWGSYGVNPDNWISHPMADEVERCFLEVLALEPKNVEALILLGNLYKKQGRFNEALEQFNTAVACDRKNSQAVLALGIIHVEAGKLADAERFLEKAWALDSKNPKTAKNIAFFYRFYKKEPESAMIWFNRYLNLKPERDVDANLAKNELRNLIERYPDFTLKEPQKWREQKRRFAPKR